MVEFWVKFIVFTIINLLFLRSKKQEIKLMSWYAVFSTNLKYYFFRTSSIILPMIAFLNIVFFLDEKIKDKALLSIFKLKHLCMLVAFFLVFSRGKYLFNEFTINIKGYLKEDIEMMSWVKNNTDKNKVFITSPNDIFFYLNYERAMFVSWKHSPQSSKDIVEWYHRLKLLNTNKDFKKRKELDKGYLNLIAKDFLNISNEYENIEYVLMPNSVQLDLPVLFTSKKNTLYQI